MTHFLLLYWKNPGTWITYEEFHDDAIAYDAYCRLEKLFEDSEIGVVLLGAPSFEDLKKTHGNYFAPRRGLDELMRLTEDDERWLNSPPDATFLAAVAQVDTDDGEEW